MQTGARHGGGDNSRSWSKCKNYHGGLHSCVAQCGDDLDLGGGGGGGGGGGEKRLNASAHARPTRMCVSVNESELEGVSVTAVAQLSPLLSP